MTDGFRLRDQGLRLLTYSIFFLSGAAALIYEVSWSRQIGMIVGHTAASAAVVLAAYFVGLAIGQAVGGRIAARLTPLIGYAAAELLVAAWACLLPALLVWVGAVDLTFVLGEDSLQSATNVRSMLCFVILLPAAIPLGATLPLMAEHLSPRGRDKSRLVVSGYAFNTIGGLVGVFVAVICIAPVGVRASGYLAAGLSAACGLAACGLTSLRRRCTRPMTPATDDAASVSGESAASWIWLALATISGFATLGLEVLYTRMFALVFHNSTYTFAAVLAVFLAGLGLGAAVVAIFGRHVAPRLLAGVGCAVGSIAIAVSVVVFIRLTGLEYFTVGETFAEYLVAVFTLVAAVVLAPASLLGMVLPATFFSIGSEGGRQAGRLAAANAIAAAVGALSISYGWTPWLGLWGTFAAFCLLTGLAGVTLLLRSGRGRLASGLALGVAVSTISLLMESPEQSPAWRTARGEEVLQRWETAYGWIDVVRSLQDGSLKVRQNLHYRHGSTGVNAAREYRQGRLPLLLHPRPADVAFLGLGTGLTAAPAIADPDVRSAVVVELIPEVVEASRMLSDDNLDLIDHPKVEIRVDDARHYLRATDRRFDVIISDLFVPWESRTGYLYTVEHYATARRRLKPGGIFCQWVALYQVGPEEFELIANSFASVFPETTIWWGHLDPQFAIVALIGGERSMHLDPSRLDARWNALGALPGRIDPLLAGPSDLSGLYIGRWPVRPGRQLNTDEHPWIEFTAPVTHRADRTLKGARLRSYFDCVLAELPTGNTRFGTAMDDPAVAKPERRRALQRLILFGSADRRADESAPDK